MNRPAVRHRLPEVLVVGEAVEPRAQLVRPVVVELVGELGDQAVRRVSYDYPGSHIGQFRSYKLRQSVQACPKRRAGCCSCSACCSPGGCGRASELADRLGVTTRSVRRDVERLRDLGYPVHASKGHGGGYQLGAGAALPPLLLDPDEAVAMAVCLRLAAGGSVAGVGESALRALSKLDQVMPARLRSQVSARPRRDGDADPRTSDSPVEPDVLMTLARACRDHEHVTAALHRPGRHRHPAAARALPAGDHRPALVSAGLRPRPRRTGAACGWTGWPTCARSAARSSHATGARRGGLRAALDQHVAVPLRGARPLLRS